MGKVTTSRKIAWWQIGIQIGLTFLMIILFVVYFALSEGKYGGEDATFYSMMFGILWMWILFSFCSFLILILSIVQVINAGKDKDNSNVSLVAGIIGIVASLSFLGVAILVANIVVVASKDEVGSAVENSKLA